jgi:hypothetical protein
MMEAVRTSETSVDNHFTRQYIPEDNSEQRTTCLLGVILQPVAIAPGLDMPNAYSQYNSFVGKHIRSYSS